MKKIFLPLLLCLLLPCAAWAETLPSLNLAGLTDLLAKNKGKVVMLNFFATWCPPCRVEIPELIKTSKAYADKGVVIISLSVDEDPAPLCQKNGHGLSGVSGRTGHHPGLSDQQHSA
mgnify:CR=1 FL=1